MRLRSTMAARNLQRSEMLLCKYFLGIVQLNRFSASFYRLAEWKESKSNIPESERSL